MSTITMAGLSRFMAETVKSDTAFAGFSFFVNVDLDLTEVPLPYFAVATFDTANESEGKTIPFKSQVLIGIARVAPVEVNGIVEEPTLATLEGLARKAVSLIQNEVKVFGVQGNKNLRWSYEGYFVPPPAGEDDLQIQIDLVFEQDKFIC